MAKLRMEPRAFDELQDAVQWYEKRSLNAAKRFCHAVDAAIDDIIAKPRMFARWDEVHRYLLMHPFPYNVIYRLDNDIITIVGIRHTSRDDWRSEE